MFKLLAAVDGSRSSDRAVTHLIHELKRSGPAEVHLLHVQPEFDSARLPALARAGVLDRLRDDASDSALASARRLLDGAGVTYVAHTVCGDPATVIAHCAAANGCDEIVMGTRGLSAIQNLLLGTVTMKTLHISDVPITLVK
jgi:nucleotide-binding universal stress UspA family protein